uniref:Hexosyltransferase n=1 Tax=Caenorhabditis japonica TaxID=281687 RepID=A0A8R1DNQ4_CAEJA
MHRWFRKINRKCVQEVSRRQMFVIFGITVILFWVFGLFDKLSEKSFDEFSWPRKFNQNQLTSKFTQFPKCKFKSEKTTKLMIIIKSSAKNGQMRDSVRKTWGVYKKVENVEVMPIFVVGHVENLEVGRKIDREAAKFEDVLAISAIDSYRNNTFKLFAAIDYGYEPHDCTSPDFLFLVDDDYMVHIPNLINFTKSKRKNDLIYEGFVFDTSPFRMKIHKHSISLDEYPFSRYPPYVSAGAVFISSETAKRFKNTMRTLKMFPFDDVFTAILAKTLKIPAIHNENFVFWNRHVDRKEWEEEGVIAVHGFARNDLELEYNQIFG